MAKLVIRSGKNTGDEFILSGDRFVLGRRSANQVPIADVKASREHAVIVRRERDFFLQDLSRNGTLLNKHSASKTEPGTPLKFGDRIKIGDTELEVVDETAEPVNIDVPGYKILDRVGSGGMGTVFKARQISMDRVVALKVLNERYSSNPEFEDRFVREARAAGKLNHPNVIHVHDIAKANGRHYFSMEFIDGASVKEMLRSEKKIEVNRALDIVLQAAKALEFAHENRIVHRDIKPDNIMLSREGIVKLADLGIAKTFEEAPAVPGQPRRVMGTPHYMAPEQALGKSIDHRVDIYALGATFYHMVTGKTPFSGGNANEILKAHIQESLPPIQGLNASVPDPVCFIIERMLAKLPEKRYPDMTAAIADIERVQRGNVAGIKRIEAGDSSVRQALDDKKEEKERKKEKEKDEEESEEPKSDTAELPTGSLQKVPRMALVAVLAVIFIAVAAAVVVYLPQFLPAVGGSNDGGTPPKEKENVPGGGNENIAGRTNPEAKKLMQAAVDAEKLEDWSEYEGKLRAIVEKYPTSPEAAEAKQRLEKYANAERDKEKRKAEDALSAAKKFEEANPGSVSEALNKYNAAMQAGKNFPEVFDPAKARVEALQRKLEQQQAQATEAASRAAQDAAAAAKTRYDYDGARAALQEFMTKYSNAPQKAEAQTLLDKVNQEAQAKYKDVQEAAGKMELSLALAEWNKYLAQVKDATAANDAASARQALEEKADQIAQDELTKGSEKAKKYDYFEALNIVRAAVRKLAGIKKWEDIARAREESLRRQKDLHERFLVAANEKLKGGALALGFPIETKYGNVQWKASSITGDRVNLDPVAAEKAPGLMKRLYELTPKEQYQLCLLFLPKNLSAEDHKNLAAFCAERGLAEESDLHLQKASAPPVAPPPGQ